MPRIVGAAARVVETGDLSIDELAGNVATKSDRISIAHVKITAPTSEPWLTLHYDEWMCVLKGRMVLHFADGRETLEVKAGQTVFIESGERFRPVFPEGDTEYVPVCLPAFRPDRCIREDEPDSSVSVKLRDLHGVAAKKPKLSQEEPEPEVLYHMCQRSLWEEAKKSGEAYFPPTFEADGFTHATAVPERLLDTANHFYRDVPGEWLCLRFRRSALRRLGIVTRDERAMPVGKTATNEAWSEWESAPMCSAASPVQVVDAEFPMTRDGSAYTAIRGLTEMPQRVFKLATAQEVASFREKGRVCSALDLKDGFVHLSDCSSAPVVAKLFFKDCADLRLLEMNSTKFPGSTNWIVGAMDDAEPDAAARAKSATTVHYLLPNGCVHVYGDAGVPLDCIVRDEHVPLGKDGVHVFPAWL
eukprot:CAMPEP_0115226746 /NCGR_PEP_ID=MMETSP0270-20121206/30789_1 /TAXON_ID=71861 /ORGANISM="Scrippsiella trochoidea, Strain CCMP3099" /LENGTH=415 /DNA_ID=CAMNT_0002641177 /DNA_START=52 /DNA_END=1298 /DNA_ORIENTATION=+